MEEKNSKTPRQASGLIARITEVAPKLDSKVQNLLNKGLGQIVKQLTSLAKSARINVEDLMDVVEDELEEKSTEEKPEDKENPEGEEKPEGEHAEPDGDEGQPGPGDQDGDEGEFGKVKTIFGKFKPEEKDYFKKRREFSKNPAYGKVKDHLDKMDDGNFNKLFD